jgi:hypothetical protein
MTKDSSFTKTEKPSYRRLRFCRVDAAGNITLFVTSHVDTADYADIARRLLSVEELDGDEIAGEQVAFVVDEKTMCMCGHEFCGNASRSFALMIARGSVGSGNGSLNGSDPEGLYDPRSGSALSADGCTQKITINTSGADYPLDVLVNADSGYTKIKMPNAVSITGTIPEGAVHPAVHPADHPAYINEGSIESSIGTNVLNRVTHVVDMGGITHLIVSGIDPTPDNFDAIKNAYLLLIKEHIKDAPLPPAIGIMFIGKDDPVCDLFFIDEDKPALSPEIKPVFITPVVYVSAVDTTYFEGSCGSGTTALCTALSTGRPDGTYTYDVHQPRGTIRCSCTVRSGSVTDVCIEGPVSISREYEISV